MEVVRPDGDVGIHQIHGGGGEGLVDGLVFLPLLVGEANAAGERVQERPQGAIAEAVVVLVAPGSRGSRAGRGSGEPPRGDPRRARLAGRGGPAAPTPSHTPPRAARIGSSAETRPPTPRRPAPRPTRPGRRSPGVGWRRRASGAARTKRRYAAARAAIASGRASGGRCPALPARLEDPAQEGHGGRRLGRRPPRRRGPCPCPSPTLMASSPDPSARNMSSSVRSSPSAIRRAPGPAFSRIHGIPALLRMPAGRTSNVSAPSSRFVAAAQRPAAGLEGGVRLHHEPQPLAWPDVAVVAGKTVHVLRLARPTPSGTARRRPRARPPARRASRARRAPSTATPPRRAARRRARRRARARATPRKGSPATRGGVRWRRRPTGRAAPRDRGAARGAPDRAGPPRGGPRSR